MTTKIEVQQKKYTKGPGFYLAAFLVGLAGAIALHAANITPTSTGFWRIVGG